MGTKDDIASIAVVIALILVASASASAAAPHVDLATADWSISQEQELNAAPMHSVWEFVNDAWGPGPIIGKLCWFRFADLHHSGELSLAIIYDGGGTADCNDFSVIDKVSTGIEEKWPRNFEQCDKRKLRARCRSEAGLAKRSFRWSRNQGGAPAASTLRSLRPA